MIHRAFGLRCTIRLVAGLMLVWGLSLPQGAQAATSPQKSAKAQKALAVKSVDKKAKKPSVVAKSKARASTLVAKPALRQQLAKSARGGKKLAKASRAGAASLKVARSASTKSRPLVKTAEVSSSKVVRESVIARSVVRLPVDPRVSAGERLGLRASPDPLDLSSSVALVVDQETSEVLFSKNDTAVLPIASLTKLMTGLVIADANLSLSEPITISEEDAAVYRNSRLAVGTTLTRGELMHLALMSSENRAANALGRTFPGGVENFVRRMNAKAKELGMHGTRYVEPTGLSSENQSSARDLATLVSVAYERPLLRSLSTSPSHELDLGKRTLHFNNSNRLIRNPEWEIGLQKTGYISEAGRCLVMQAKVAGRKLIMVFLDSAGKLSRAQDAERVRRWVEAQTIQQQFFRPQG